MSGRLYLLDGAILTGVFGLVCLASLATPRPLMFHFALETNGGAESPRGREFADLWRYAAFRRVFVIMTVVWGLAFVVQAAISATIIEATSTDSAFVINKFRTSSSPPSEAGPRSTGCAPSGGARRSPPVPPKRRVQVSVTRVRIVTSDVRSPCARSDGAQLFPVFATCSMGLGLVSVTLEV